MTLDDVVVVVVVDVVDVLVVESIVVVGSDAVVVVVHGDCCVVVDCVDWDDDRRRNPCDSLFVVVAVDVDDDDCSDSVLHCSSCDLWVMDNRTWCWVMCAVVAVAVVVDGTVVAETPHDYYSDDDDNYYCGCDGCGYGDDDGYSWHGVTVPVW